MAYNYRRYRSRRGTPRRRTLSMALRPLRRSRRISRAGMTPRRRFSTGRRRLRLKIGYRM